MAKRGRKPVFTSAQRTEVVSLARCSVHHNTIRELFNCSSSPVNAAVREAGLSFGGQSATHVKLLPGVPAISVEAARNYGLISTDITDAKHGRWRLKERERAILCALYIGNHKRDAKRLFPTPEEFKDFCDMPGSLTKAATLMGRCPDSTAHDVKDIESAVAAWALLTCPVTMLRPTKINWQWLYDNVGEDYLDKIAKASSPSIAKAIQRMTKTIPNPVREKHPMRHLYHRVVWKNLKVMWLGARTREDVEQPKATASAKPKKVAVEPAPKSKGTVLASVMEVNGMMSVVIPIEGIKEAGGLSDSKPDKENLNRLKDLLESMMG